MSAWLLWHTEVFPLFNSLVAVTGVFAWLASLGNVLSKERKESLQRLIERRILARTTCVAWLCGAVVAVLVFLSLAGSTVVLRSYRDDQFRAFRLEPAGELASWRGREGSLPSHSQQKRFLWHFGFLRDFNLRPSNLPETSLRLPLLRRTIVNLPTDAFIPPRMVVRPNLILHTKVKAGGYRLSLVREGKTTVVREDYRGQAVWLGSGPRPELPLRLENRWRDELDIEVGGGEPPWLPAVSADSPLALLVGDRIQFKVVNRNNGIDYSTSREEDVRLLQNPNDFPQQVVLREPDD